MKRVKVNTRRILAGIVLTAASGSAYAFIDSYTVNREKLPDEAQEMLTQYFPKAKIGMIKVDRHLLKKTDYDVKLVDGTRIEFSNSGKWKVVDCNRREVPEELVPKTIRRYLNKNFMNRKVTMIEKKTAAYRVGLADGVVLKFDLLGSYKGVETIDDSK